jgi:myosin heavy subunit
MSYAAIIQELPPELQLTMLKLVETVEQNMRAQLAVRREDFDSLRAAVQELAAAQQRTEQRVEELAAAQQRTEQRVEELAAAQQRTEQRVEELAAAQQQASERLDRVEAAIERLTEAQTRTEERLNRVEAAIEQLIEAQTRTEEAIKQLVEHQNWMRPRQDKLMGAFLENQYRQKAPAYFGRLLRRARVVSFQEIEDNLESRLPDYDRNDLFLVDLLVQGRPHARPESPDVWLAVEVSVVVDREDVERAQRRAAILKRAGYTAIATVAGEQVTRGGEETAHAGRVLLIQDGKVQFWEEALAAALAE